MRAIITRGRLRHTTRKNDHAVTDSCNDLVFTLDHAPGIGARRDVSEADVVRKGAEERNSIPDQYGQSTDDETVYQPGAQKFLNGDAPVHI